MEAVGADGQAGRRLPWPWFLVVVVVYLGILQGVGRLTGVDTSGSGGDFPTAEAVVRNALIPIGLSIVFGAAVVTWLGWWGVVSTYRVPVRRWVRWVPISMLLASLLGLDYGRLADQGAALVVCLLLLGVFVGVGEELMFRGIGVHVFKRAGFGEAEVALWSSAVFGLAHISNAVGHGAQAVVQAVVVSTSGYFFYLCLRVGGVILLPMLVHGLWDTSLISSLVGIEPVFHPGLVLIILLQAALIVVLIVRRRSIEPAPAPDTRRPFDPAPRP
ncbi:hypothetical protein KNE206_49060 [Kitasatospora sp. NE20-6]|uniref:CPBP family intramembrane glutamic endopeptidase n=1 Tax=Kitasatospora sp. NE20-6 TaxID=2859066 RepID=UPI0034DC8FAD